MSALTFLVSGRTSLAVMTLMLNIRWMRTISIRNGLVTAVTIRRNALSSSFSINDSSFYRLFGPSAPLFEAVPQPAADAFVQGADEAMGGPARIRPARARERAFRDGPVTADGSRPSMESKNPGMAFLP